jgi:FtsH-binding integral membrane protein
MQTDEMNLQVQREAFAAKIFNWVGYAIAGSGLLALLTAMGIYGEGERGAEAIGWASVILLLGAGLIIVAHFWSRRHQTESALRRRFPDEPWRWRKGWTESTVRASQWGEAGILWLFTVAWAGIFGGMAFAIHRSGADGPERFVVYLPLFAIFFLLGAVGASRRALRFGTSSLHLETLPAQRGGRFLATLDTRLAPESDGELKLTLSCSRYEHRQVQEKGQTKTRTVGTELYSFPVTVRVDQAIAGPHGLSFPIAIPIPSDVEETGPRTAPHVRVQWSLAVSGPKGYVCSFEVPVYGTAHEAWADTFAAPVAPAEAEEPAGGPWVMPSVSPAEILSAGGVRVTPAADGGTKLSLPATLSPGAKIGTLAAGSMVLMAALVVTFILDVAINPLFALGIGLVAFTAALYAALSTSSVVVNRDQITLLANVLGLEFSGGQGWFREKVGDIVVSPNNRAPVRLASARRKVHYAGDPGPWRITLIDDQDDMHVIAEKIADRDCAEVIALTLREGLELGSPEH